MRNRDRALRGVWLLAAFVHLAPVEAQQDALFPLNGQARPENERALLRAADNTFYIYENAIQQLPLMDDLSIDRTRHLNAAPDDPGVVLTDVVYRIAVGGVSTPDMAFYADTTFHFYTDTVGVDTTWREANPFTTIELFDLGVYPSTSITQSAWPAYTIYDTIGDAFSDTLAVPAADLMQDSLEVYTVPPDARTYVQNGVDVPLILWADDDAHINGTYPIDPPTIGVATFDGVDRTGLPYVTNSPTAYGINDHLTTVPINMAYPPGDSIYLSFFYQPQGRSGDTEVQTQDSLVLEFYAPDDDEWIRRWSTPYTALAPFEQVMLPITDFRFLKPDFRFRFLNYGTRSGALDHWHIDYVRLARQRAYDDTLLVDVAWVYPGNTLLNTYTSVPFTHFSNTPAAFMAPSVDLLQKNLADQDRFITWEASSGLDGGAPVATFGAGSNIINNAGSTYTSTHAVAPFAYDPLLSTGAAFWRNTFAIDVTPDINRYNDTMRFVQELSNYYALDDGSAEAGYGLTNAPGGKVAVRFDMQQADSLRAVRMYFDPIFFPANPDNAGFLLTVWSSLNPETIIHQNFSFSDPDYRPHGLNKFVEYPLDSTIWVPNTFYVGFVQTTATFMNVGFDKNTNNQSRIFYNTTGSFTNTTQQGSLMIRPVLVADVDPFTSMPPEPEKAIGLWPNPATDALWVRMEGVTNGRVELWDATGRLVLQAPYAPDAPIALDGAAPGSYVVRLVDAEGAMLGHARLMLQR
ncbi:MAG: T9SS type A sorting domain-containing protein [Flavobacteriales bacterium]|nr:T9SS type A sorting domain-containing protein [Flavobacteriales bacterium]MBK7940383.1 T9SS type A sorting domain-containing protein [Flavobacteriales bacterium]MBK9699457.1 T9SS type A sorting domain-containing protein [Flavobacteriales bacterium]